MFSKEDEAYLGPVDTAFLHVESPTTPMNIGGLSLWEGRIPYEALVEHIDRRIHRAPAYMRRLVIPPLNIGQPRWMPDPNFDVHNHVFGLTLDKPGTEEQLRQLVGRLVSCPLDRSKPLWEVYLIDGLEGDRTATLFKVHHAMVDGIAAIELFTILVDLTPESYSEPPSPLYDPLPLPDDMQLVRDALVRDWGYKLEMVNKLGSHLSFLGSVVADPDRRRHLFQGAASLLSDAINPPKALAINGRNSGTQHIAWAEFPLAEVHLMRGRAGGASVNDVMLSLLATAIDRYETVYHGLAGRAHKSVRVLIPINMRQEVDAHDTGNRISVLPIDIPLAMDDPLARLKRVAEYTRTMKASYLSNTMDAVLTFPALTPAIAQPLIWSAAPTVFSLVAHTWCTNVAGPQLPVYMLGHELQHSFGFFPLNPSMGLATVILSYNGHITMTLIGDAGIIPDVRIIRGYLEEAYVTLREAVGVSPITPVEVKSAPMPAPAPAAAPEPAPAPEPVALLEAVAAALNPEPAFSANGVSVVVYASPADAVDGAVDNTAVGTSEAAQEAPVEAAAPDAVRLDDAPVEAVEVEPPPPAPTVPETPSVAVAPAPPALPRLFSPEWAVEFHKAINANKEYRRVSTGWRAGSLSFVLRASPKHGYPVGTAAWMDLERGECREARSLSPTEAVGRAAFVIEGDYAAWLRVLDGKIAPLAALARGDLRLSKGSLIKLLPYTQSAQELVHSAQRVPLARE